MDIHNIRQLLRAKTIYDLPLRVTFYARVSSESDEQLNSLGNQIGYYEDFIRKIPPGPLSRAILTRASPALPPGTGRILTAW